jgi:hypothetical protein
VQTLPRDSAAAPVQPNEGRTMTRLRIIAPKYFSQLLFIEVALLTPSSCLFLSPNLFLLLLVR